jgi:hypothetical protein
MNDNLTETISILIRHTDQEYSISSEMISKSILVRRIR